MKRLFYIPVFIVLFAALLSGCDGMLPKTGITIDLEAAEKWTLTIDLHIPEEFYAFFEDELETGMEETLAGDDIPVDVEYRYEVSEVNDQGNYVFSMILEGTGYDSLNEIFEETVVYEQSGNIFFEMDENFVSDFSEISLNTEIILNGGRIIETNGTKEDNNTVTWLNPSTNLTAEMKKPGGIGFDFGFQSPNWLLICGGLFMMMLCVLTIAVVIFFVVRASKKSKEEETAPKTPAE